MFRSVLVPDTVTDGILFDVEADFRFGGRRRRGHELADGVENYLELGVVLLLQVG
jgi:hypothetical protein